MHLRVTDRHVGHRQTSSTADVFSSQEEKYRCDNDGCIPVSRSCFVDQSQFQPAVLQWTATNNRCSLTGRSDEGYWFESMLRGWYLSLWDYFFLFIKLFWDKLLLPPADWFQVLQVWILLMVQSEKNWSQNSFKCLLAQKHNLTSKVKYCDVKVELQRTVVISRPLSCD